MLNLAYARTAHKKGIQAVFGRLGLEKAHALVDAGTMHWDSQDNLVPGDGCDFFYYENKIDLLKACEHILTLSTLALLFLVFADGAFSGGSVGGNPPSAQLDTLVLMSRSIEQLLKVYADQDELRRVNARLFVTGNETAAMNLEGTSIQVRKLRDKIVDDRVSKEILPSLSFPNQTSLSTFNSVERVNVPL